MQILRKISWLLLIGALTLSACGQVSATEITADKPTESTLPTVLDPELFENSRVFEIIPEESEASYTVDEQFFINALEELGKDMGLFKTVGVTNTIEGRIIVDADEPQRILSGEFVVDLRTLNSDESRRDRAIQNRHLESSRYPFAIFKPSSMANVPENYVEGDEATGQLVGEMTIREITQPLTFEMRGVFDGESVSGVATATLLMTDYGFDPPNILGLFKVEDEVLVMLEFVAREVTP
jgi:polyisoprenoid-binding protein YceI